MASRPTHFEIPVDDPDRAEKFYSNVFGWTFNRFEGSPQYYGLAGTGEGEPGIDGALLQRGGNYSCTVLTMSVDSIEEAAERVTANGGKVTQEKAPVPGMGWFAVCEDSEGNAIGLWVTDPNATM